MVSLELDEAAAMVMAAFPGSEDITEQEEGMRHNEYLGMVKFAKWLRKTNAESAAKSDKVSKMRLVAVVQCDKCGHYGITTTRVPKDKRFRCIDPCPGTRIIVEEL